METPSQNTPTALLVFAKSPIVGTVKTRMQPQLSNRACLILHDALLRHTLTKIRTLDKPDVSKVLYLTGNLADAQQYRFDLGLATDIQVETQVGRDLGERLVNAMEKKFDEGFRKVVFIGADTPLLSAKEIGHAIDQLSHCEVVIGPTTDGGYYLIGFSASIPAILRGIDWGTPRVYGQTLSLIQLHQVRWKSLAMGSDLDTFKDLSDVGQIIKDSPSFTNSNEGKDLYQVIRKLLERQS
jgi:rSAM/selenodomain-associated transferase 1